MSRNEIRLRRHRMTSRSGRFRNYGHVLQRYEREMRIKKLFRVFVMFAIILVLVVLLLIVMRVERKSAVKSSPPSTSAVLLVQVRDKK